MRPCQQKAVKAVYEFLRTKDTKFLRGPADEIARPRGHSILMHDGLVKKVEDIAVGDLLMGNDGRLRIVYQALRGREEMVRVSSAIWKPRHEKVLFPRRGRAREEA